MAVIAVIVFCLIRKISLDHEISKKTVERDSGDYFYKWHEDEIALDEDESVIYIDHLLLVFPAVTLTEEDKKEIAGLVDGRLVGEVKGELNCLQLYVQGEGFKELSRLSEVLLNDPRILYATYDFPIMLNNETAFTSDPWRDDNDHDELNPDGTAWWAEAIGAYTAWNLMGNTSPINVGIIDNGFETTHADLQREDGTSVLQMMSTNDIDDEAGYHGTHVAGIIAAQNNTIGLRGIADRANIFCIDHTVTSEDGQKISLISNMEVLSYTMELLRNNVKVINNSWGDKYEVPEYLISLLDKIPAENIPKKQQTINERYRENTVDMCITTIMMLLLRGKDDFLIIQSSGNGVGNNGDIGVDTAMTGWYRSITDTAYKKYVRQNRFLSASSYKIDRVEMVPIVDLQSIDISYEKIKEHIIIVGGVNREKKNNAYVVGKGFNYGSNVDITAPAVGVYSCILNNDYGEAPGTSMAAPMVTGSAALVWSVRPDLTAGEVKQMLLDAAVMIHPENRSDPRKDYPMLNVGNAMKQAISPCRISVIDDASEAPVSGTTIRLIQNGDIVYEFEADENGLINEYIRPGTYEITADHELYSQYSGALEKEAGRDEEIFVPIHLNSLEISDYLEYAQITTLIQSLPHKEAEHFSIFNQNCLEYFDFKVGYDDRENGYAAFNGNPEIRIFGFKPGDSVKDLREYLLGHRWVGSYSDESREAYCTLINGNYYLLEAKKDEGKILSWFLTNTLEGDFSDEMIELQFIDSKYAPDSLKTQFLKAVGGKWHTKQVSGSSYQYDVSFEEEKVNYADNASGKNSSVDIIGVEDKDGYYLVYLKDGNGNRSLLKALKSPCNRMEKYSDWQQSSYQDGNSLIKYGTEEPKKENESVGGGFTQEQARKIIYRYLYSEVSDFAGDSFDVDSGYGSRTSMEYFAYFPVGEAAFGYANVTVNLDTGKGRVQYIYDYMDLIADSFGVWPEIMIPEYDINLYDIQ